LRKVKRNRYTPRVAYTIMQRKSLFTRPRISALIALALLICLSMVRPLAAQTVTQGYGSDGILQRGMLVAIKQNDASRVEALTEKSLDRLKGVVVQPNDSPVTLSAEGQKVFVATSGNYEVLVSDQNGPIKTGDYISISSLEGIGMKADDTQSVVLGRAVSEFDGNNGSIGSTDVGGAKVNFARIEVNVAINRNPLIKVPEQSKVPKFLARFGESVADKPVSATRMYLSLAIFLAAAFISGVLLYSGARNSLTSIGRNPLSKKAILRGLLQITALSLTIFILGIFAVYLLLKV
jgi:hypothetical protein